MQHQIYPDMGTSASILTNKENTIKTTFRNMYEFECYDSKDNLKWKETVFNIVVDEGLDEILNQFYKGSAYTASHYVGLTDSTPTVAAGDTMSSHAGWAEVYTEYTEATREALTLGSVSAKSVDNSASKASFAINAAATIGGAFVTTDNTKNGTSGILIGVADFAAADRVVADGDTLNVTVTLTAATA